MTTHVLAIEPPRPGLVLHDLVSAESNADGGGLLDVEGAATLAGAMIQDAAVAVANSGGDLLITCPSDDQLPVAYRTGTDPETELRELLAAPIGTLDDVTFESLDGDSDAGLHEVVTDQLSEPAVDSVALLDGRAPTVDHTVLDGAAMKLRRSEVVIGPAPGGRVSYLGLTEPVAFDSLRPLPALPTVVERAVDAGHDVDFLPVHPRVDDPPGLATVVALIRARRAAGRRVPDHTAAAIESLGIVVETDGQRRIRTSRTDRA